MSKADNEMNREAFAWIENFCEEMASDPDIIDAMPIEDVRKELRDMGADVEGFHSKLAKTLASSALKSKVEKIITWISESCVFPLAGEPLTASAMSEQEHPFKMDYGEYINISCYWRGKSDDVPPFLKLSWNANITSSSRLWARFTNPDTQETFSELSLGTELEGKAEFEYDDLGFDPSDERWGISILLEAV